MKNILHYKVYKNFYYHKQNYYKISLLEYKFSDFPWMGEMGWFTSGRSLVFRPPKQLDNKIVNTKI